MQPLAYKNASLPESILGIECKSFHAGKIALLLSYFKVPLKKGASKIALLQILSIFCIALPKEEETVVRDWLSNENATPAQLAIAIRSVRGVDGDTTQGDSVALSQVVDKVDETHLAKDLVEIVYCQDCPICAENLSEKYFPHRNPTSTCKHDPTLCKLCLQKCIDNFIAKHPYEAVECPECKELITDGDLEIMASREGVSRYKQNSFIDSMRDVPNFFKCLNPTCLSGQIHDCEVEETSRMTCNSCDFRTCVVHQLPWHTGLTCKDYDTVHKERTKQEAASQKYLVLHTKQCPGCGIHTVKEGKGCGRSPERATCDTCLVDYCWICLVPYSKIRQVGATAHGETCQYRDVENKIRYKTKEAEEPREAKRRKIED